jgi:hypothetical protein
MLHLGQYCWWNEDAAIEIPEYLGVADQDEVIKRRRVGDNDHVFGRSESAGNMRSIVAISDSNSSIV